VLVVASGDWDSPFRVNCHEIALRWSDRGRVVYLEPAPLRAPHRSDWRRAQARLRALLGRGPRRERPASEASVEVVRPVYMPWHPTRLVRAWNTRAAALALRRSRGSAGGRPVFGVVWFFSPALAGLERFVASDLVIYHAVDEYSANPGVDAGVVAEVERRMLQRADVVFAASEPLAERLRRWHRTVMVWENVADPEPLVTEELALGPAGGARPQAAFVGNLSEHKVDFPLLLEVVRLMPAWEFLLAGAAQRLGEAGEQLLREPNVRHVGPVPRNALRELFQHADAALLPLPVTRLHDYSFPIKVLDYLAMGLPVVGRRTPSLRRFHEFMLPAGTAAEYQSQLGIARALRRDPGYHARSVSAARSNSWQVRIEALEAAIRERVGQAGVST
jgi:glycosyltransferase involved in cell wall biosynthesis